MTTTLFFGVSVARRQQRILNRRTATSITQAYIFEYFFLSEFPQIALKRMLIKKHVLQEKT